MSRLITALLSLRTDDLFRYSIVIVDNDDKESARRIVERFRETSAIAFVYAVEPERSISLARNRCVRLAEGELVAFIDDDEFPADTWLLRHIETLRSSGADGVLGPVIPHFDAGAPRWLVKSGLCERPRFGTGSVIHDARYTRTGNVLIRRDLFTGPEGLFDPKYGRSGGGDAAFFKKMIQSGRRFVWCDEACVFETVPAERQTRGYYLRRAFTRGMAEAWGARAFSRGTIKSLVAILLYTPALPFLLLLGQHRFMKYAVKDCDHLGKILGHMGINLVRERPYASLS